MESAGRRTAADLDDRHIPDVGLVGSARETVDIIIHWLNEAEIAPSGFTLTLPASGTASHPIEQVKRSAEARLDFIETRAFLNTTLPEGRIVTVDAGRFMIKTLESIDVTTPRRMVHTASFGSIGLGLAYAIGAGAADPERLVVPFVGDGGFMLGGLAEFNSAVRNGTNLVVIVCNDGSHGAEHVQLRNKQMDLGLVLFDWPDFAPLPQALGGRGVTVRTKADLGVRGYPEGRQAAHGRSEARSRSDAVSLSCRRRSIAPPNSPCRSLSESSDLGQLHKTTRQDGARVSDRRAINYLLRCA